MKVKISVVFAVITILTGCDQLEPRKVTSFTPMHCKHIISGYEIKWTKAQSIEVYGVSGVKVHNELDGAYVVLDKSKEKDYACTPLGGKVSIN